MDKIYNSTIEALIFASDEPISENDIIRVIKGIDGEEIEITSADIQNAIDELNTKYESNKNSFRIIRIANGFLFATRKNLNAG